MDEDRLIQDRLQFKHRFMVHNTSKVGGLVLFWKEDFKLYVQTFSKYHIDAKINQNTDEERRFKGFYGEPDTNKRHETWNKLRRLRNRGSATQICAGDFNEITRQSEKIGGRIRPHNQMEPFREVLDECKLIDLGFVGSDFTWYKHYPRYTVWEWLDRAVATDEWLLKFPDSEVYHLDVTTSDHKPLWIVLEGVVCTQQRPFRFEQMWMTDKGCGETIEGVWKTNFDEPQTEKILRKIDQCGLELTQWSKKKLVSVRKELETKRKKLARAKRYARRCGDICWLRTLEVEINAPMDKEAKMRRQRSRVAWLRDGDKNNWFFHTKAMQRRRRNSIKGLFDEAGQWCTNQNQIVYIAVNYYQHLFTSSNPDNPEEMLAKIPQKVTEEMNEALTALFTAEEVEKALKQM